MFYLTTVKNFITSLSLLVGTTVSVEANSGVTKMLLKHFSWRQKQAILSVKPIIENKIT